MIITIRKQGYAIQGSSLPIGRMITSTYIPSPFQIRSVEVRGGLRRNKCKQKLRSTFHAGIPSEIFPRYPYRELAASDQMAAQIISVGTASRCALMTMSKLGADVALALSAR
jgi:hypothetical protein